MDKIEVLKLGPKFCLYVNLTEESFEADIEESSMKLKWDLIGEDRSKDKNEDIALKFVLGEEECDRLDEEREEELEILDAETRTPFNQRELTFNYARRRVTDIEGNSRVYFPRKTRSVEDEALFETFET